MNVERLSGFWPELGLGNDSVKKAIEIEAQYAVYLDRQSADIQEMRKEEERLIPDDFDYSQLPGLSNELKQKLQKTRPRSIAHAMKIEGMTPAAISLLLGWISKLGDRSRLAG